MVYVETIAQCYFKDGGTWAIYELLGNFTVCDILKYLLHIGTMGHISCSFA